MPRTSSLPRDVDVRTDTPRLQRAGLRAARASHEPTDLFAVVEMTVLVVVTALAMVSVIVSGAGDKAEGREPTVAASSHHAGLGNGIVRRVDAPHPRTDEATR